MVSSVLGFRGGCYINDQSNAQATMYAPKGTETTQGYVFHILYYIIYILFLYIEHCKACYITALVTHMSGYHCDSL